MFDLQQFIIAAGYIGLFLIVFAESGLLIGFFLPGDSLLFTAGFLASQGYMDIFVLAGITFVAAVLGDSFGFEFGKKFGPKVFKKEDSFYFKKINVERAQKFFDEQGGKTIIFARFVPVVRTFAPILAGVGKMPYKQFLTYNVVGGLLWAVGLTFLGYFLGKSIPDVDKYLLPIIALIVVISLLPNIIHLARDKEARQEIINIFRKGK